MTPRINEPNQQTALSGFSTQLISQLQNTKMSFQLSGSGPLFQLLHPALIKCTQIFENSPNDEAKKRAEEIRMDRLNKEKLEKEQELVSLSS